MLQSPVSMYLFEQIVLIKHFNRNEKRPSNYVLALIKLNNTYVFHVIKHMLTHFLAVAGCFSQWLTSLFHADVSFHRIWEICKQKFTNIITTKKNLHCGKTIFQLVTSVRGYEYFIRNSELFTLFSRISFANKTICDISIVKN